MNEEQYYKDLKTSRMKAHVYALINGACRYDKEGRIFYMVPTSVRRNSQMIIPDKTIKVLLKKGNIGTSHIDNIRPY